MILRPMYIEKIMPYVDAPFVKVLSGVRRSGKSTILRMIVDELKKRGIPDESILHYSLDSMQHENIKTAKSSRDICVTAVSRLSICKSIRRTRHILS